MTTFSSVSSLSKELCYSLDTDGTVLLSLHSWRPDPGTWRFHADDATSFYEASLVTPAPRLYLWFTIIYLTYLYKQRKGYCQKTILFFGTSSGQKAHSRNKWVVSQGKATGESPVDFSLGKDSTAADLPQYNRLKKYISVKIKQSLTQCSCHPPNN